MLASAKEKVNRRLGLALVAAWVFLFSIGLARAEDHTGPVIRHTPAEVAPRGQALRVEARIDDQSGVAFPRVYYRKIGEPSYNVVSMQRRGDRYVAMLPGFAIEGAGVEYYLEAFDEKGNGPTHHGRADRPHRVKAKRLAPPAKPTTAPTTSSQPASSAPVAAPEAPTPWYKKGWVWIVGGVVVAAATATIVAIAVTGGDEKKGFTLQVDAPTPTPSWIGTP